MPTKLDAVLYYRGLGLVCGPVRWISVQGMSIDTGPMVLHSDTPIEVALSVPGDEENTLYHLRGVITDVDRHGIELRFHNLTASMRHSLQKILRDERSYPGTEAARCGAEKQPV